MASETVSIVIKAFDQTQKALRGIKAAFGKLSKVFFSFKTALVAAVGAGGLGLLVSNSLKATDALAKTSSRIGTTTEALSKLQYAGELAGIETNTLNMAMQRFVRRTAEATRGTGEAVVAFRALNINANELQALPLDQRMRVLARSFKTLKTEEEKLAVAFKLFDSEGTAVLNMLKQTDTEMQAVFDEAKRLGLVMSTEAAQGVENANDAFTRLRSIFTGLVRQMTAALAPALELIATRFKEYVLEQSDARDGIEGFGKYLATQFIGNIRHALIGLQGLVNAGIEIINTFNSARRVMDDVFNVGKADPSDIRALQSELREIDNMLEGGTLDRVKFFSDDGLVTILGEEELRAERKRIVDRLNELGAEIPRDLKPVDFSKFLLDPLADMADAIGTPTKKVQSALDDVESAIPAPSKFQTFLENLNKTRQEASDLTQPLMKLGDQAITGLATAFTNAITGAENFAEAIRKMAKNVIDSLIQMLIQKYIVDAAFGAIVKFLTPKDVPAFTGPTGIEFGPAENYVGKYMGGPVTGGRPYLVGERGPELMVPSGNGKIVPNNALGGAGVTVVQNINVTTGVQQTVRAEIANLLPQISNAAKSAVADARMRGGGFSKAMAGV